MAVSRRAVRGGALLTAMLVLLAGCTDTAYHGRKVATLRTGGAATSAEPVLSDEDRAHQFEKCMADRGIRFPKSGEEAQDFQPDQDALQAAEEACRHLLPNGGQPPPMDPKQLDDLRAQAKCMREHGVDIPDPDPNNPYIAINSDVDQAALQKAAEACQGGPNSSAPVAEPTR